MVNEKNNAVGCAMSRYKSRKGGKGGKRRNRRSRWWLYLVCNYAYTNIPKRTVYHAGRSASKCNNKHDKYKALCAPDEAIRNEP